MKKIILIIAIGVFILSTFSFAGDFHIHAMLGQRAKMKEMLDKGQDIDALSWTGINALHSAASNGDLETCKFLLEHGANKYKTSEVHRPEWGNCYSRYTASELAKNNEYLEVADFIKNYKSPIPYTHNKESFFTTRPRVGTAADRIMKL